MKHLMTLCKLINNWTTHQITAKEEAEQILKFMLLKNDIYRTVEVYKEFEKLTALEMQKQEREAIEKAKLIQSKWGAKSIVKHPDFDKKLNEIEVEYKNVN